MANPNASSGPPADRRRDDFSTIFGAPPPGRSRTMTSFPDTRPVGRAQTMAGQWPDQFQHQQLPQPHHHDPQYQQYQQQQQYQHYQQPYQQQQVQARYPPSPHLQPLPHQHAGYVQNPQFHQNSNSGDLNNPVPDHSRRPPPGPYLPFPGPGGEIQRAAQPQSHHLPQPLRPEGRPTGPQRIEDGYRSHTMSSHPRQPLHQAYPNYPGGASGFAAHPSFQSNIPHGLHPQSHSHFTQHGPGQGQGPGGSTGLGTAAAGAAGAPHLALGQSNPNTTPSSGGVVTHSGPSGPVPYKTPSSYAFRQPGRHNTGPSGPSDSFSSKGAIDPNHLDPGRGSASSALEGRSMSMSMVSMASARQSAEPMPGSTRSSINKEISSARSSVAKDSQCVRSSIGKDNVNSRASVGKDSIRSSGGNTIVAKTTPTQGAVGKVIPPSHSASGKDAHPRRAPVVYPALLSRVAEAFRTHINLSDKSKDGLVYKDAFTGTEAVYLLAYIIKTQDLNLALLLGRALDAQKLFHDVTYTHRLRESSSEVYQLREPPEPVNGVFTLMAECYSPTCTPFRLCYSIACPRRLEQQTRLKMKLRPGLKRQDSRSSVQDEPAEEEQRLWINTVSKSIADSVDEKERKRQEVISELIYTERDFVKDLEYLRDFWIEPLWSPLSPVPEERRKKFVKTVFSNCMEVHAVNSGLADALTKRQKQSPVVHSIGDIFLQFVPRFGPFVQYGGRQMFGKHEFETERRRNPLFSQFVDATERKKESRKLELNGYLTKPTTRLARYPLLLENIAKYTKPDNPDAKDIPAATAMIREVLNKVNAESGRAENRFSLERLDEQVKFRPGEFIDLKLRDPARQLLHRGTLKKTASDPTGDVQAFLFDHAVLFVRAKAGAKREELKPYRRPIALELLTVSQPEAKAPSYPLTFRHLGRGGFELTLYCSSSVQQQTWVDKIVGQQDLLRSRSNFYTQKPISVGFFGPFNRVTCCAPISKTRLLLGADQGTYILDTSPPSGGISNPTPVFDYKAVSQVDVLQQNNLVLILTEKTLYFNTVDALTQTDQSAAASSRSSKITPVNFFKSGYCNGQYLVSCVRSSALSTTVKVYKAVDPSHKSSRSRGITRLFSTKHEPLDLYKVFYIPSDSTSLHYLRSKLCVGCTRGFEVVSLDPIVTQSLLDQADTSLDFVRKRENVKPIHIERLDGTFLLCYSEFSFFVDRNGWRVRPEFFISWEGNPVSFAVVNTYILAFEPSFIEVRHLDTGVLMSVITAKNVRMLHASKDIVLYAYEDDSGNDVIASLDFWSHQAGAGGGDGGPNGSTPTTGSDSRVLAEVGKV